MTAIDFLIVTPLAEERDAVLQRLDGHRKLPPSQHSVYQFYRASVPVTLSDGTRGSYEVVVLPLAQMGHTEAASATAQALQIWKPQKVILVGIAGGVGQAGIQLGDVLISEQVADYELQKVTEQGASVRWQVHRADERLLIAAQNFTDRKWESGLPARPARAKQQPKVRFGPICTGNKVIAKESLLGQFREVWSKLIGVEMEAGGVANAASSSARQTGFFMVRGVSDLADDQKDSKQVSKWRKYACQVAAAYTVALIKSGPMPLAGQAVSNSGPTKDRESIQSAASEFSAQTPSTTMPHSSAPSPAHAGGPNVNEFSRRRDSTVLRWLHLTDLHAGSQRYGALWPNVRSKFIDDLKLQVNVRGPIDLVIFSGDFVDRANWNAAESLLLDFFGQLWRMLSEAGSAPKLFAVPGNHDLVAAPTLALKVFEKAALKQWPTDADLRREFWTPTTTDGLRGRVHEAFVRYSAMLGKLASAGVAMLDGHTGLLAGDGSATIEKGGKRVGLLGLNSTFLQLSSEFRSLVDLDIAQAHAATPQRDLPKWRGEHDACLLVTHHPPALLTKDRLKHYRNELGASEFAVHLCGDLHEPEDEVSSKFGQTTRMWLGGSLGGVADTPAGEATDRVHSYSIGEMLLPKHGGWHVRHVPRIAVEKRSWAFDRNTDWELAADQATPWDPMPSAVAAAVSREDHGRRGDSDAPPPPLNPIVPPKTSNLYSWGGDDHTLKDRRVARALLERLLANSGPAAGSVDDCCRIVRCAIAAGVPETAKAYGERAIQLMPHSLDAQFALATSRVIQRGTTARTDIESGLKMIEELRSTNSVGRFYERRDLDLEFVVAKLRYSRRYDRTAAKRAERELAELLEDLSSSNDFRLWLALGQLRLVPPQSRESAETAFKRAITLAPLNSLAHASYAKFLAGDLTRRNDALTEYREAIRLDEKDPIAHMGYSKLLADNVNDRVAARIAFQAALRAISDDARLHIAFAHFLATGSTDDRRLAERHLDEALRLGPDDSLVHSEYARFLVQFAPDDQLPAAVQHLKEARELAPDDHVILVLEARMHERRTRDLRAAIDCLQSAVEIAPADARAWSQLGSLLRKVGTDLPGSCLALERSLIIDPTDTFTRCLYARTLARMQGKEVEADAQFLQALREAPDDAHTHFAYARFSWARGRRDLARHHFRQALHREPENGHWWDTYAQFCTHDPELHGEAAEAFDRAAGLVPLGGMSRQTRRNIEESPERRREAIERCHERLRISPDDAYVHYQTARWYAVDRTSCVQAESHFLQAIALRPDDATIVTDFARFLARVVRDRARALAQFSLAHAIDSDNMNLLAEWAAYVAEGDAPGDLAEADRLFQLAIAHAPESRQVHVQYAFFLSSRREQHRLAASQLLRASQLSTEASYKIKLRVLAAQYLAERDGDSAAAEALYKETVAEYPDNALALAALAQHYSADLSSHIEASIYFELAIKADPANPITRAAYAHFLSDTLKPPRQQEAANQYLESIRLDGTNPRTRGEYALFLWEWKRDWSSAKVHFQAAITLDGEDAQTHTSFANVARDYANSSPNTMEAKEATILAMQEFTRAVELEPSNDGTRGNFAVFLWKSCADVARAKDMFVEALFLNPANRRTVGSFVAFLMSTRRRESEHGHHGLRKLSKVLQNDRELDPSSWLGAMGGLIAASGIVPVGAVVLRAALNGSEPSRVRLWPELMLVAAIHLDGPGRERAMREIAALVASGRSILLRYPEFVRLMAHNEGVDALPDAKWFRLLADVLCGDRKAESLAGWAEWAQVVK